MNSDFEIEDNMLKKYNGTDKVVKIPRQINIIGSLAFENNTCIEKIIFHDEIMRIEPYAFSKCVNLKEINLENVKEIYDFAFIKCSSLKYIDLSNLQFLRRNVFENCVNLESVTLSNKMDEISDNVFCHCFSLKKIKNSENIEIIRNNAFYNCKNLKKFNFNNTRKIYFQAFHNTGFEKINLENIDIIEEAAFSHCKKLISINLKNINQAKSCFNESNVKEIQIENCKTVSFNSMKNLEKINIKNKMSYYSITSLVGTYNPNLTEVTGPDIITEDGVVYNNDKTVLIAYLENNNKEYYKMPDTIKQINPFAFYEIKNLKKIELSKNLEILESNVLDVKNLEYLKINNNIKRIENCSIYTKKNIIIEMPNNTIISPRIISDDSIHKITIKTKEKNLSNNYFKKFIENYSNIEVFYQNTLEELIESGKSFQEANKIIKEYER